MQNDAESMDHGPPKHLGSLSSELNLYSEPYTYTTLIDLQMLFSFLKPALLIGKLQEPRYYVWSSLLKISAASTMHSPCRCPVLQSQHQVLQIDSCRWL